MPVRRRLSVRGPTGRGAITAVLAVALLSGPVAFGAVMGGEPLVAVPTPPTGGQLGYVSAARTQLSAALPGRQLAAAVLADTPFGASAQADTPPRVDAQAGGRGGALVWVGHRTDSGNTDDDGELWYQAAGGSPARLTDDATAQRHPVLSPDGTRVAFASDRPAQPANADIWVLHLADRSVRQVTDHPADDSWPSWSPDGNRITFTSTRDDPDGDVYTVAATGGPVTRVTDAPGADREPAWSPDGARIAFATARFGSSDVVTVPVAGGPVSRRIPAGWVSGQPAWSPDGSRLAFTSRRDDNAGDVYVAGPGGGPARVSAAESAGSEPTWWTPGDGPAFVVFTTIVAGPASGIWSADGDGQQRRLLTDRPAANETGPAFSPDGSRLAYAEEDGDTSRIVVADAEGNDARPLTAFAPGIKDIDPTWSPDGTMIAFVRVTTGPDAARVIRFVRVADGAVVGAGALPRGLIAPAKPAWSPTDMSKLAVRATGGLRGSTPAIWVLTVRFGPGSGLVAVAATAQASGTASGDGECLDGRDDAPAWSPDGANIVFSHISNGERGDQLCVVDADGGSPRVLLPPDPVRRLADPAWSPDGLVIAYAAMDAPTGCDGEECRYSIWSVDAGANETPADPARLVIGGPGGASEPAFAPAAVTAESAVELTATVAPNPGYVGGDDIAVTFMAHNRSPRPVEAAWLAVAVPAELQLANPPCEPPVNPCWLGAIAAGGTASLTVRVRPLAPITAVVAGRLSYQPAPGRTVAVQREATVVVVQPILAVNPATGSPGFVTVATGSGFPPGAVLTLLWQEVRSSPAGPWLGEQGIPTRSEVTVDAAGRVTAQVLVFPRDRLGPRKLVARWVRDGARFGEVSTPFLVVAGPQAPPRFIGRG